jgi:CRP-like cAMP-binding protein
MEVSAPQRLGESLVQAGHITQEQLVTALEQQETDPSKFIGEILVELEAIAENDLTSFLVKQCRMPYVSLLDYLVDVDLLEFIPQDVCLKHRVLPVDKLGRNLTVAMVNPLNHEALEEVKAICEGLRVKPILCDASHFKVVAGRLFEEKGRKADGKASLSMTSLGLAPSSSKKKPEVEEEPAAPAAEEPAPAPAAPAPAAPAPAAPAPAAPAPVAPAPPAAARPAASAAAAPGGGQSLASAMQDMMGVANDSMKSTYQVLARRVKLFRGLKADQVQTIFTSGATREVEAGHTVFEKGAKEKELYVILSGKVRIVDDGKEIGLLSTGDMFGEMAVVTGEPRVATAVASATTSLFAMNEAVFRQLLTKQVSTRVLLNMLNIVSQRIRVTNETLLRHLPPGDTPTLHEATSPAAGATGDEAILAKSELFRGADAEDIADILSQGTIVEKAAGETVYEKGSAEKNIFVILSGVVHVTDGGKPIAALGAGNILGEVGMTTGAPHSTTAVVVEASRLFIMSDGLYHRLLLEDVGVRILVNVLVTLGRRQKAANARVQDLSA